MRKNQLIVVIHAQSETQALENVQIAFDNGADGVFLINHDISPEKLQDIYAKVDDSISKGRFLGVNFLGVTPIQAVDLLSKIWNASAIWMDDIGYMEGDDNHLDQVDVPLKVRSTLRNCGYAGQLFAGVDFKYRKPAKDLTRVTKSVFAFANVITTSGPATGLPPALEKLEIMRRAVPEAKIAIASGMTPENVNPFLNYVDYFLVATGISKSHTELDPARVRMMADKMRR
ncbi:MAG: BtpA/SgcQ family protein [Patescibacteria group bacterium]